jgi:hypothetical protein
MYSRFTVRVTGPEPLDPWAIAKRFYDVTKYDWLHYRAASANIHLEPHEDIRWYEAASDLETISQALPNMTFTVLVQPEADSREKTYLLIVADGRVETKKNIDIFNLAAYA